MEQYAKQPSMTERQIEWMQEQLFEESGPFYQLSTKPLENDLIFTEDEERKFAINQMAILVRESPVEILAFALMSNHFHFIIRGNLVDGLSFFRQLKKKLSNYLSRRGKSGILDKVEVDPDTPAIKTLTQLRNEIAYVIRNPYAARTDVNPLAWPWCTGYLYFNPLLNKLNSRKPEELTYRERRMITRTDEAVLASEFRIREGMIVPESFVNYRLVEQLFPNARKFTWWVFKHVEGQVEVAARLGEKPNLNDDELYKIAQQTCRSRFRCDSVNELPFPQRKELALELKNKWSASNKQIARIARLEQRTVNELFPLSAK